jgi:signal transduction histidine kinase
MRERASELGGEYVIENNPSGGTRVKAQLPLALSGMSP